MIKRSLVLSAVLFHCTNAYQWISFKSAIVANADLSDQCIQSEFHLIEILNSDHVKHQLMSINRCINYKNAKSFKLTRSYGDLEWSRMKLNNLVIDSTISAVIQNCHGTVISLVS